MVLFRAEIGNGANLRAVVLIKLHFDPPSSDSLFLTYGIIGSTFDDSGIRMPSTQQASLLQELRLLRVASRSCPVRSNFQEYIVGELKSVFGDDCTIDLTTNSFEHKYEGQIHNPYGESIELKKLGRPTSLTELNIRNPKYHIDYTADSGELMNEAEVERFMAGGGEKIKAVYDLIDRFWLGDVFRMSEIESAASRGGIHSDTVHYVIDPLLEEGFIRRLDEDRLRLIHR